MRLDDRAADRQSHPHALRLGRHERLENSVRHFVGKTGSRIGHGDLDGVVAFAARLDNDQSLLAIGAYNCIHRVPEKVQQHLFDLNVIGQDGRQVRIDPQFDLDLALRRLDAGETDSGVDQRRHLDEGSSVRSAADELAEAIEDVACTFGLLHDFR